VSRKLRDVDDVDRSSVSANKIYCYYGLIFIRNHKFLQKIILLNQ